MGEAPRKAVVGSQQSSALDTFGGRIPVEWDHAARTAAVLHRVSQGERPVRGLGSGLPAGHHRYAHSTAIRHDGIHPELLGVSRLVLRMRHAAPSHG